MLKTSRLHRAWAPAALLALALFGACGGSEPVRPRNVVLICIDTLRADHLSCYGYERQTTPALDDLAGESLLFTNTRSTAGWTKPSVPSFLTGTYPLEHGVYLGGSDSGAGRASDVLPASATTLAEVFRDAGYQAAAFVKNAQLSKGLGFEQGFDLYVDRAGDAREIRWRATDWLEARDPERPFFLYLHLLDAHWPWPVPEEYRGKWADGAVLADLWRDDWSELRDHLNASGVDAESPEAGALRDVYDGAIRWVDDQLALFLAELEEEGLGDDTVVCVISDHGEEFFEHGRLGHGHGLWDNLLAVPWILHVPGGPAGRIDAPASLVDVFPTLLSAARLEPPSSRGVDRLATPEERALRLAEHLEPGGYQRSLERGGHKLLREVEASALLSVVGADETQPELRGRWKARLEPQPGGALLASRLTRDEEDAPGTEVKGPIESIEAGFLVVSGVQVATEPLPELYGETRDERGQERSLAAGMLVKARGARDAQGLFRAEKLKLYAPDAEREHEVRGQVTRFDAGGSVWLGQVEVRFDPGQVELELDDPRLDRAALARWLQGEPVELSSGDSSRDLAQDPGELLPLAGDPFGLGADLERLTRALFLQRTWANADRVRLSDDALQELKAIGYAE